jgi:hypothetical protein
MPATLRERGVAVPFTSPALAGARIRLLDHRPELVLPHPAGARGVYIFPLASLAEYCAPTLHDVRLSERLMSAFPMSPTTVRRAARITAAEGAAGRAAASAAQGSLAIKAAHIAEMGALLIGTVIESGNPRDAAGPNTGPGDGPGNSSNLDTRHAVLEVARRAGRSAEAIKADIDGLAASLVACGLDAGPAAGRRPGRCRLLSAGLRGLEIQIASWRAGSPFGVQGTELDPAMSLAMISVVASAASVLVGRAQADIADLPRLLRRWAADPAEVASELARADWMLDGWEPLWLLWRVAEGDRARADAIAEMSVIMPTLPGEMEAWFADAPELQSRLRASASRPTSSYPPAIPREATALIARNERMRALAA